MTDVQLDQPVTTVGHVRHSPVMTILGRENLWDAWQLMFVSGMRHLVVVDESGLPIGMLSDRAILTDLPLTEDHLAGRRVSAVMSAPGHVTDDMSAQEAASKMARHAVDALPIVSESGRPVALLTSGDLVAWVARD